MENVKRNGIFDRSSGGNGTPPALCDPSDPDTWFGCMTCDGKFFLNDPEPECPPADPSGEGGGGAVCSDGENCTNPEPCPSPKCYP